MFLSLSSNILKFLTVEPGDQLQSLPCELFESGDIDTSHKTTDTPHKTTDTPYKTITLPTSSDLSEATTQSPSTEWSEDTLPTPAT